MTSSIINYVVEKYLANILEINTENTKSSLFSGTVEMGNLKIKPHIFNLINVPYLELVNGYVGSLKIKMSLPRFYKYPIKIFIDKVLFNVRQKSLDKLNEEKEIQLMEEYKEGKLQSLEEISSQMSELSAEEPGMVQQIINNLQIEIGDVFLRFEDSISCPGNPFVFGAILKKILIKTTTNKFEENGSENIPFGEINHKLIKVQGLSMFLDYFKNNEDANYRNKIVDTEKNKISKDLTKFLEDSLDFYAYCLSELNVHSRDVNAHRYLLYDLTTKLQVAMNENVKANEKPKIAASVIIDALNLNIELKQLTVIFKLLGYLSLNNFYRIGIYKEYYKKELTLKEKKEYMEKYIEYYKFKYVKKYLNVKEADKIKTQLNKVESGLTYDQIQSMRQAAMIKIEYVFNVENIETKITDIKSKWKIFSVFSSNSDQEQLKLLSNQKEKLLSSENQYENLIEEQLAKEKGVELDMYKGLPIDYVLYIFNLEMKSCVFSIGELDGKKLIDLVFSDFETHILLGLTFQNIFLYLNDFCVNQYKQYNPIFNKIIESYEDPHNSGVSHVVVNPNNLSITGKKNTNLNQVAQLSKDYSLKKGALYIEFENNPENELSNYRFKLRNEKRLYVYANLYVLQYAMNKIMETMKSNIDLKEISKYAKGEVYKYIEQGYVDKIFSGEYQHSNIDIDLLFRGPVLVIPQNIHDQRNTSCMLFSMGECQISSSLPPRMDPKIDYTKIREYDKLYDIYTMSLQGFNLSTMGDFTSLQSIAISKTKLDLLSNVNIELKIGNLIEPKNEYFENFRFGIKISNVQFFLRDVQIEFLIDLLDGFMLVSNLLKEELENSQGEYQPQLEKSQPLDVKEANNKINAVDDEKASQLGERRKSVITASVNAQNKQNLPQAGDNQLRSLSIASAKKDKNFFAMEFVLYRVEFIILKSLSAEEIPLYSKIQSQFSQNAQPFKNYLSFVINNINFGVTISEKKNMIVNLKIFNMFLFDNDYVYKQDTSSGGKSLSIGNSQIQQELLVHPEFQCIMGSINEDDSGSNSNNQSRSASIYSEAHEDPEIIYKKKAKKIQSFIEISYKYLAVKNKSVVQINFTKLLISLNLSTFNRLILFATHYQNMMNRVTSKHQIISNKTKISNELKKKLQELKDKKHTMKAIVGNKKINQKFFKKVVGKLKEKKGGNNNKSINDVVNFDDKTSHVDAKYSFWRRASIYTENEPTQTVKEKSKFKLSFEMKEIELNFPLNPNSENTKVLKLNFNMMIKMKMMTEVENILTIKENRLIRQNFLKKNMNLNLMVFNVDFDVVNFLNNNFVKNLSDDKILSNSRVTIQMRNFLILEKETIVTNVELHVEPISMIIGFRQINVVLQFANSFSQFSQDLAKSLQTSADSIKEYNNKDENYLFKAIDDENEALKNTFPLGESEYLKYKEILNKKINEMNSKLENQVKYNTKNFNALMDVNFKLDKAIIKLIDNTGYHEIPLAKIELSKVSFKLISNSDPCDADNMAQALVEMMTRKEIGEYNIYNLYKFMDACFNIEVSAYNEKVSDWEPILEPWNATVKMTQVDRVTRLKIDFNSDLFLNLNLSYSSVQIFNQMMKKLKEDESKWLSEEKNYQIKTVERKNTRTKKFLSDNEISLEITNSSGVDFTFWLDADEGKNKYTLKTNEKKYFTKDEIYQINKKIKDSEISLLRKDKFSFTLLDSDPIESIDFSYNHFTNLRVKLGKNYLPHIHSQFDFVEICIKIQNSGLIKSITIESNVAIHNNTNQRLGLLVVKSNDFINNLAGNSPGDEVAQGNKNTKTEIDTVSNSHNSLIGGAVENHQISSPDQKNIFNFEEAKVETIEPNSYIKVPLTWLLNAHMILGRVRDDSSNQKSYKMLYDELNFVYNLRDEYNSLLEDVKTENQKENMTNTLSAKYSKIISIDYKNKPINFSLDMMILRSKSDMKIENDIRQKNPSALPNGASPSEYSLIDHSTFYYIIAINPPVVIENQIPYPVDFSCDHDSGNLDSRATTTHLLPLQKFPIFYVNHLENKNELKISLNYFKSMEFESEMFSFMDNMRENKKIIRLKNKKNASDFYDFTIKYETYEYRSTFSLNYLKLERNLSKSKKITFYIEYLIVNKMDISLFMKADNLIETSDEDILKLTNNNIYPHKVNLFNIQNELKAKIKSEYSAWSKPLQINTHGVEGVVNLESKLGKEKDESYVTDVALIISSSTNFNNSTIITLEPRYLLVNRLGIDLDYRQVLAKEVPCKEVQNISIAEEKVLTFKKINEKVDKILKRVQFLIPDPHNLEFSQIDENWSPIINLDSIDEFDLKLLIPPEQVDKFKKNPIIPEKDIFTYDGVNNFLLIHVTINTLDNGLIHIILAPTKNPQYLIKNHTQEIIILKQEGLQGKTSSNICKILPNTEVPFTWSDLLILNKSVLVNLKTKEIQVSFENIEKLKEIKISENKEDNFYIYTSLENKNHTKVLQIQQDFQEDGIKAVKQVFVGKKISRITKVNVSFKGIGLSIIDEVPQEVFYISIYGFMIKYVNNVFKSDHNVENTENVEIYVKNFQIDYCLEDSFKLLIFPKNQLIPSKEKILVDNNQDIVPFVGLLITRKTFQNLQTDTSNTKISQIDFTMQELNVKIDQFVINTFVGLVNSLLEALDFYKADVQNIAKDKNSESIPADYCPSLNTELPEMDKLIQQGDTNMLYIEALMLSALKINLTLRIDISTLEINLIPGFITKILGTVGNAIARISDSPLRFSELAFHNCFLDANRINQFKKHYTKQGIIQFYKILGSSDLIGNPIGLVDKLGTGFIELFNEPRKGFVDGPLQFGEGLAKGLNSLVSNVIGGGFETVGKITGTLYTATK